MITIYLAGPILGCDYGEANNWRSDARARLHTMGMRGISPLRCEPLHGDRYQTQYADERFGTPKAIASKNFMDVQRCDLTLAYFPLEETERKVSLGTVCELSWAFALRKPTIVVSKHKLIKDHPVIVATANWVLSTLDDAYDTIEGLFTEYGRKA